MGSTPIAATGFALKKHRVPAFFYRTKRNLCHFTKTFSPSLFVTHGPIRFRGCCYPTFFSDCCPAKIASIPYTASAVASGNKCPYVSIVSMIVALDSPLPVMIVVREEPGLASGTLVEDGWRCWICGRQTDRDQSWSHPNAATIDHVIPLAKGGGCPTERRVRMLVR